MSRADVSKALDDCPETTAMVDESRKPTARLESMIDLFRGDCFGRIGTVNDTLFVRLEAIEQQADEVEKSKHSCHG